MVRGGGGGGGATSVGRMDRWVRIWEVVDTVGEVARRVWVRRVVWLVSSRRGVDLGGGGDGVERESAVQFVRRAV